MISLIISASMLWPFIVDSKKLEHGCRMISDDLDGHSKATSCVADAWAGHFVP